LISKLIYLPAELRAVQAAGI